MKRRALGIAVLLAMALAPAAAVGQQDDGPKLIVLLSVDQLRGDLLDRYEPALEHGLKRFIDHGYQFTSGSHAHAVTHTAAGHGALSTGTFPSRSGIVANSWEQRSGTLWSPMYAVQDLDSPILDFEEHAELLPGRSPKNLLRSGLADWVRAADPGARTFSVSSKDRAAITMAGQTDSNVYWLLPVLARFVTSTFYGDEYPDWVTEYNERVMPEIVADTVWKSEVPADLQHLARADSAAYEGRGNSTFPHRSSVEAGGEDPQFHNAWSLNHSPSDAAVVGLAKRAVDELDLGQRNSVDYLGVSLSATDYVGHGYGPFSQEQLSNIIHLDRVVGELFDYLDEEVGEGRWVAALSADHGVVTNPEAEQEMGNTGVSRYDAGEMNTTVGQLYQDAARVGGDNDEIARRAAELLEERGIAARAYTHHDLTVGEPADSFAILYRNSHYPGRAHHPLSKYGIEFRYAEGDLVSYPTGTTHGSPYWYDRWVPIVFLGAGIEAGSSDVAAYTVDVAPTLAALAGVRTPDDLDGRAIYQR